MSSLGPGNDTSVADGGKNGERATRLWLLVVLVAALLPALSLLSALALVIVTNNLDPAFELGVSDTFFNGLIIAMSGVLTGLFGGGLAKIRGWARLMPPMAALIIGVAIFAAFASFGLGAEVDNSLGGLATIWVGQAAGIILATRFAGLTLAGAVAVLAVAGIGIAAAIQAIPGPPAEVLLILEDYTYDDPPGGECWGVGELSKVMEGSRILLFEFAENSGPATQVGSVVLPAGTEGEGGCMFELGNPLGGAAVDYADIDFRFAADSGIAYGVFLEGHRVVIRMGLDR